MTDSTPNPADTKPVVTPPLVLPTVPLRNTVVYPSQVLPLTMGREMSVKSVEEAMAGDRRIVVVAQKNVDTAEPAADELYAVGCIAEILKLIRLPDGSQTVLVQGKHRARILDYTQSRPNLKAVVQQHLEPESKEPLSVELEALEQSVRSSYLRAVELAPYLANEHAVMAHNAETPGHLADMIISTLQVDLSVKQEILETLGEKERLERINQILSRELEVLELSSRIQSKVQGEVSKSHREYYLRQQLKAIRAELGEDDEEGSEIEKLRTRVAEAGLPPEAAKAVDENLRRLERTPEASPEHGVIRNYLETILDLPWKNETADRHDLKRAREILDRDHWGMDKAKKRIIEYLAVRQLKPGLRSPILCFVGPPGVGKTSLGRSIAEALDRRFVRLSLGGVRDEAEIRGHRRTYIGALPGRILQGIKKAGSRNPVFVLDEIDKLASDFRGDPSSALLEVLDPEQNSTFSDHYLEVPYDLSRVMFIATANWKDPIPAALLDRMEVVELSGYSTEDKVEIAEAHLLPKQLADHGVKKSQLSIPKLSLEHIVQDYTRESGVRTLDRTIADVVRGAAREIAEGRTEKIVVSPDQLVTYLGRRKFQSETAERSRVSGVATGLAWTPFGGDILFVEASKMAGQGRIQITGQLGDVMKESAHAALTILRAEAESLGLAPEFLEKTDVHVHVPAGAVPKDGPSAGVALLTALVSLFLGRPVKSGLAMSGEITLRGQVLPVGGIREKVLAAKRAGIRTVILPDRNRDDVEEIPLNLRKSMTFIFAKNVEQVLKHALVRNRRAKTLWASV